MWEGKWQETGWNTSKIKHKTHIREHTMSTVLFISHKIFLFSILEAFIKYHQEGLLIRGKVLIGILWSPHQVSCGFWHPPLQSEAPFLFSNVIILDKMVPFSRRGTVFPKVPWGGTLLAPLFQCKYISHEVWILWPPGYYAYFGAFGFGQYGPIIIVLWGGI